jgi:hypothetical protein
MVIMDSKQDRGLTITIGHCRDDSILHFPEWNFSHHEVAEFDGIVKDELRQFKDQENILSTLMLVTDSAAFIPVNSC